MPDASQSPAFALDPSLGLAIAYLCGFVASICSLILIAPRLAWPDKVRGGPEPVAERPDWSWPWVIGFPPLIILFQLVLFPLKWLGVRPNPWLAFGISSGSGLLSVVLAWWFLCRRRGKPARALGLKLPRWKPHLVLLPIAGYPLGISLALLAVLFEVFALRQPLPSPQKVMFLLKSITDPALRIVAIVAISVVAPIAEEILFRGILFRALRYRWGLVPGMLVSSAVFAAAHLDLQHAAPLFVLGMLFAFVAEESKSVYPCIVLHGMVNGIAVFLTWKLPI